jgi:septal ring-binding cell division protein DamX
MIRATLILTLVAGTVAAQVTPPATRADSVFARAQQLVTSGNAAAGRTLVDSMVAAATPDTPTYADALYWRAALGATSTDAERDYRRIVVEYPASRHAGDALWQLSQLEVARGDRAAASTHLDRFLLENPKSPERNRAGLQLVRLLFEQNQLPRACGALRRTLAIIPDSSVETRNQLQYYSPRCVAVDVNPASQLPLPRTGSQLPLPRTASQPPLSRTTRTASVRDTTRRVSPPRDTTRHDSTARRELNPGPVRPIGKYTLQIAAFPSMADAVKFSDRLNLRGFDARVVGAPGASLFRVRIGRYATRAEAVAAQSQLKERHVVSFVTVSGADDK